MTDKTLSSLHEKKVSYKSIFINLYVMLCYVMLCYVICPIAIA